VKKQTPTILQTRDKREKPKMDESQLTPEEIETELTQSITFHAVYAIICLYHLKPSKKIKKTL
jgi:hypothetical protein